MNIEGEKLSDQLDIASAIEQKAAEVAISAVREASKKKEVEHTGNCLFCGEQFPEGSDKRFCDSLCRDDWQYEKKYRRVV